MVVDGNLNLSSEGALSRVCTLYNLNVGQYHKGIGDFIMNEKVQFC